MTHRHGRERRALENAIAHALAGERVAYACPGEASAARVWSGLCPAELVDVAAVDDGKRLVTFTSGGSIHVVVPGAADALDVDRRTIARTRAHIGFAAAERAFRALDTDRPTPATDARAERELRAAFDAIREALDAFEGLDG